MKRSFVRSKTLLLLPALALILLCTACGGSADGVSGQLSPSDDDASISMPSTVSPIATPTPEPTPEPTENADLGDAPVSLGRIQGGTYTNEYMGLACSLDSTWEFYTAEELQELPEDIHELFEGSELEDFVGTPEQFMDMQAECTNDMTTINIVYQKLTMSERVAYAAMSEADVIDETLSFKDLLIESYAQAGIDVEEMSRVTVSFLGEERPAIHTTAFIGDIPYFILQVSDYHLGQYSVTITFSSFLDDNTRGLLDLFYKYP